MNGGENVAKQIEGVYDKLIECAKAEFLEKGFKDASLRTIAKNAHTSTNSIYVRFGDKAGLLDALVKPHYETVINRYIKTQTEFQSLPADIQRISIEKQSGDCLHDILDYCYEHLDEMRIILTRSDGTKYSSMVDEMAAMEVEATRAYQQTAEESGYSMKRIDPHLEHIIATGMINTFFELVIHDIPYNEAETYLAEMRDFYTAGWMKIMGQT